MLDRIEARLPAICRDVFGPDAAVIKCVEISPGAENHVFSVDVDHAGTALPLILKLFSLGAEAARTETELLRKLRARGFPAAVVLHAELDAQVLGLPFSILQRIDGTTLGAAMRAAGPDDAARLLRRFAELAARLHGLDASAFHDQPTSAGASLDAELERYHRAIRELEAPEFWPVYDWLLSRRKQFAPRGPSLVHLDYHPFNVMLDGAGELHVLDWTLARVSDPRSDLAQTFQVMASGGFSHLRAPITQAYEAASAAPLEDMDFFDVFAALKNVAGRFAVLDDGATKRPALWARLSRRPHWERRIADLSSAAAATRRTYQTIAELSGVRVPEAEALFARLCD